MQQERYAVEARRRAELWKEVMQRKLAVVVAMLRHGLKPALAIARMRIITLAALPQAAPRDEELAKQLEQICSATSEIHYMEESIMGELGQQLSDVVDGLQNEEYSCLQDVLEQESIRFSTNMQKAVLDFAWQVEPP